jgi:hypothetical protein
MRNCEIHISNKNKTIEPSISLALKAHASSALNADPRLMFSAKQHKKSASLFLKIPPQEEVSKLLALF